MDRTFEVNDRVYVFTNGHYDGRVHIVAKKDEENLYVIPTDCEINGEVPTLENYKYPMVVGHDGVAVVKGLARIAIYKAEGELKRKIEAYNLHCFLINRIFEELNISGYRFLDEAKKKLMSRTKDQLALIYCMLVGEANGKTGSVHIEENGKMNIVVFQEEERVREPREPM